MAMAWAPPTAYTSSTPRMAQVARMVLSGRPSAVFGGVAMASDSTPAAWAGTAFMMTELGYTALPPGTYRPTRCTGIQRSATRAPGARSVWKSSGTCDAATARERRTDSSMEARTAGSSSSSAAVIASVGTRRCSGRTWSNFSSKSRSAAAPRALTSSRIGWTSSVASSVPISARGMAASISARVRRLPRRSMIRIVGVFIPAYRNNRLALGVLPAES